MKPPSEPSRDFLKKSPLTKLPWTKVSRRSTAAPGKAADGDVVYGVRTSEDIARGFNRRDGGAKR